MLWVDAISQQALSALYISRLAKVAGDGATAREFEKKWKELRRIVNKYYWDDSDGCYYDIVPAPSGETASVADVQTSPSAWRTTGILTPASFWPMLAEIPSKAQARRMAEFALRPDKLGGEVPWVTVSRDDPDFNAGDGWYWRGSMWLPTAYMGIKALEKYDFQEAADTTAEQVLSWMLRTYRDYDPAHNLGMLLSDRSRPEQQPRQARPSRLLRLVGTRPDIPLHRECPRLPRHRRFLPHRPLGHPSRLPPRPEQPHFRRHDHRPPL